MGGVLMSNLIQTVLKEDIEQILGNINREFINIFREEGTTKTRWTRVVPRDALTGDLDYTKEYKFNWDTPRQPLNYNYDFWVIIDPRSKYPEYADRFSSAINKSNVEYEIKQTPYEYDKIEGDNV